MVHSEEIDYPDRIRLGRDEIIRVIQDDAAFHNGTDLIAHISRDDGELKTITQDGHTGWDGYVEIPVKRFVEYHHTAVDPVAIREMRENGEYEAFREAWAAAIELRDEILLGRTTLTESAVQIDYV